MSTPITPTKGLFVVFEGGEGAGKTTQARLLSAELSTTNTVLVTRQPGGTTLGKHIRSLLFDNQMTAHTELLLHAADKAEHVHTVIRPALNRGDTVICDRYADSSLAHQTGGRHLHHNTVKTTIHTAIGDTIPDIVIILDIDPRIGLQRARQRSPHTDRYEQQPLAYHQRVRDHYLHLATTGHGFGRHYLIFDADQPTDQLAATIHKHLTHHTT